MSEVDSLPAAGGAVEDVAPLEATAEHACGFPRGPLRWADRGHGRYALEEQRGGNRVVLTTGMHTAPGRNYPAPRIEVTDALGCLVPITPNHPVARLMEHAVDYRLGMAEMVVWAQLHGAPVPLGVVAWASDALAGARGISPGLGWTACGPEGAFAAGIRAITLGDADPRYVDFALPGAR